MPVYEYQCKACGLVFEREHAIGEKKQYKCPDCSSSQTIKLVSHVGVIFKGSGFYATDSRKGNGCCSGNTHSSTCSSKKKSSGSESKSETESPCKTCPLSEN